MHIKIGNHIHFCRIGTEIASSPSVVNASSTNAPTATVGSALGAFWKKINCVSQATVTTTEEGAEEIRCPAPESGKYVVEDIVGGTIKMTIGIDGQDFDPLTAEVLYGSEVALVSGSVTDFTPGQSASVKGWLLVDQYSHTDTFLTRLKLWGRLTIAATDMGDKVVKPKYLFTVLDAAGNSGEFDSQGID